MRLLRNGKAPPTRKYQWVNVNDEVIAHLKVCVLFYIRLYVSNIYLSVKNANNVFRRNLI